MNWDYRVIPVDELFPEQDDHDIAVSKHAATNRRARMGRGFEQSLIKLGNEGWEFVNIVGDLGIFKKPR